ncbi:MAG: DUF1501 domain-containing protein, partial [Planctomycetota bacterium]
MQHPMTPIAATPASGMLNRRRVMTAAAFSMGGLAVHAMSPLPGMMQVASALATGGVHHGARAKRVIFLFMHGGPSHVDTFDYKPRLARDDGKDLPFELPANMDARLKL